jgi:hypothetical protein
MRSRFIRTSAFVVVLQAALGAVPAAGLDRFTCYQMRPARDATPVQSAPLDLADAFEEVTGTPGRSANFLCNPASRDGGPVGDPTAHLACYKMRYERQPAFAARDVTVQNEFGEQHLKVYRRLRLCVPSEKNGVPSSLDLDHFRCYAVRSTSFTALTVTLVDQFTSRTARVQQPVAFCDAVDKNGEGVKDPSSSLTCYEITTVSVSTPASGLEVSVANQLGAAQALKVKRASLLCVPGTSAPLF